MAHNRPNKGPGLLPMALRLPCPLPMRVLSTDKACLGALTRVRHSGEPSIQSP
jgi:hypothetical protein